MPMTLAVTRNPSERIIGFLASCMCEVAPGIFTGPRMSKAVRERVWAVLSDWYSYEREDCSIVLTWPDDSETCGQAFLVLGCPRSQLQEVCGVVVRWSPTTVAGNSSAL